MTTTIMTITLMMTMMMMMMMMIMMTTKVKMKHKPSQRNEQQNHSTCIEESLAGILLIGHGCKCDHGGIDISTCGAEDNEGVDVQSATIPPGSIGRNIERIPHKHLR